MNMVVMKGMLLWPILLVAVVKAIPSFRTESPFILDDQGRVKIFHGTNFVQKGFPWYPEVLLNEKNIVDLASLGVNTIRLGFMWTGAEPVQGQFNETYFDIMGSMVDNLHKHGITPYLDVHQDVMSTYFCLYDGFPTWAVDMSATPSQAFPWPLTPGPNNSPCSYDRGWAANYLSDACGVAFQTLYHEGPMRDAFSAFWKKTAEFFKDKPILGYEIINEPWAGDIYSDPKLLLPGHAGSVNLAPFYDVISESIRSVDPNRLVFFEPVTWGMIFNGELLGSGFDHVPGNRPDASVLSFHYYCWWYSEDSLNRKTCDRLFGPKVIEAIKRDMKAIGGSAMMTEWGQGCNFDDPNAVADPNSECNVIMDLLESHHIGWSDWYFGGQLNEHDFQMSAAARQIFSRTYARSIAGRPVTSLFDVASKKYRSCWTLPDDSITSDITEIFASFAVNYPNGVDVDTTPNIDVIEIIPSANSIKVRNHRNAVDRVACITIHPKSPAL